MKILLGTESFAPNVSGVATATKNLATNLIKNGHEVVVLTPGKTYNTKLDKSFTDYQVFRLKSIINPFRKGYRITFVKESEIEKLVEKTKPDLIHIQDPAVIGQLLCRVGNKLNIPVVCTNHFSLEYALSYVKFFHPLMPILRQGLINYLVGFYNKCDQIVTPTETFRRQIEDWGVESPVRAVSNGIEIERFLKKSSKTQLFDFREKFHLPDNPLVLYLGRIDKDKSIDVLVRAIPSILKKVNAHFIIAGTGGEVENIRQIVHDLNITSDVTFIGFLEHNSEDFVDIYKSASLFAIPSTIETQSLVTLEAMSSGLPVVAADANALPELVHPGENGYLFKPGNEKQIATMITKILSNKKLAKKMGGECIKIAMNHQMDRAFDEMLSLYKEVIDKKKKEN